MDLSTPEAVAELASTTGRNYVSVVLEQNGEELGSMTLELFNDLCPKTVEHFLKGVAGTFDGRFKYQGTPIHRIVKHAFVQGGDVVDGTGKGQPGWFLADETFQVKHDAVGMLGFANNGEPHTAATQFYITLKPLPWMDGKRVVFGRVVDDKGLALLEVLGSLPCNNERPLPEVTIKHIEQLA